jgi:Ion channel
MYSLTMSFWSSVLFSLMITSQQVSGWTSPCHNTFPFLFSLQGDVNYCKSSLRQRQGISFIPRHPLLLSKDSDYEGEQISNSQLPPKLWHPIKQLTYLFFVYLGKGIALPFPKLTSIAETKQSSGLFTLQECIMAIVSYLLIGAIAYTRVFERWTLIDSLYFSVASFSTVGTNALDCFLLMLLNSSNASSVPCYKQDLVTCALQTLQAKFSHVCLECAVLCH